MKKQIAERRYYPQAWQLDTANLKTERVQFWMNGTMRTAQMSKADAISLIEAGAAFIISEQAIGALRDGYSIA